MRKASLYDYQEQAVSRMKNGCILCGGVGTGKSRTSLAYYCENEYPKDLYIFTTAKKRDSNEWETECRPFDIHPKIIDSWNNLHKYTKVYGAFFIFDEQRVSGSGAWAKAFIKITRRNHWVLLSATPGDKWQDYIPVFVANGFYKNKTEFLREHAIWNRFSTYPKIDGYLHEGILMRHRNDILVTMEAIKRTRRFRHDITVHYDKARYQRIWKDRWDIYDNCPIEETGKLMYLLRKVVNDDDSRVDALKILLLTHPKAIVFYNFQYECEIIEQTCKDLDIPLSEWNGHKHENLPTGPKWCYAVQYSAGAEGWNCITTNVVIFYSQSYSYRSTEQAAGRIDRANTPFKELHYYYLRSFAPIDSAIHRALSQKKDFNESAFIYRSSRKNHAL